MAGRIPGRGGANIRINLDGAEELAEGGRLPGNLGYEDFLEIVSWPPRFLCLGPLLLPMDELPCAVQTRRQMIRPSGRITNGRSASIGNLFNTLGNFGDEGLLLDDLQLVSHGPERRLDVGPGLLPAADSSWPLACRSQPRDARQAYAMNPYNSSRGGASGASAGAAMFRSLAALGMSNDVGATLLDTSGSAATRQHRQDSSAGLLARGEGLANSSVFVVFRAGWWPGRALAPDRRFRSTAEPRRSTTC